MAKYISDLMNNMNYSLRKSNKPEKNLKKTLLRKHRL